MFTETYLPTRDGVVTSVLTTKRTLEEMGHEVYIFAPEPADEKDKESGVFYFKSISFRKYPSYRIAPFPSDKCRILRELDVDLIHSHGLFYMALRSMFAARSLKKPVVISFHTMVTDAARYFLQIPIPENVINRLAWIYLRELLERANAVVVPSHAILEELKQKAPTMKRVEVIPTGIDCSKFNPTLDGFFVRKKYGVEKNRIVLHLGRISWEKNIDLVLRGFSILASKYDDVVLMIVGDGPARSYYMKQADDLRIADRVIFTGFVPDDEIPLHYAACDAFITASKFETQGLVILEAMACGKPVAGINYRAVAEIIGKENPSCLFEEDPVSCANAIENALNCKEENRALIRNRATQFSAKDSARKLCRLYDELIKEMNE